MESLRVVRIDDVAGQTRTFAVDKHGQIWRKSAHVVNLRTMQPVSPGALVVFGPTEDIETEWKKFNPQDRVFFKKSCGVCWPEGIE